MSNYYPTTKLSNLAGRIATRWISDANKVAEAGQNPTLLSDLLPDKKWCESFIYGWEIESGLGATLRVRDHKMVIELAKQEAVRTLRANECCTLGVLICRLKLMNDRANSPSALRAKALREEREKIQKRYRQCEIRRSKNILGTRMTSDHLRRLREGQTDTEVAEIRTGILKELSTCNA